MRTGPSFVPFGLQTSATSPLFYFATSGCRTARMPRAEQDRPIVDCSRIMEPLPDPSARGSSRPSALATGRWSRPTGRPAASQRAIRRIGARHRPANRRLARHRRLRCRARALARRPPRRSDAAHESAPTRHTIELVDHRRAVDVIDVHGVDPRLHEGLAEHRAVTVSQLELLECRGARRVGHVLAACDHHLPELIALDEGGPLEALREEPSHRRLARGLHPGDERGGGLENSARADRRRHAGQCTDPTARSFQTPRPAAVE